MFVMPPVFNSGDTIEFYFDSYDSNGASVTITGLAVTDVECYKNGSTTQRASDNGITLLDTDGIDFDGSAGLQGFAIDTSDNSDAGFWTDGARYLIHVNAVTIDAQTVRLSFYLTLGYLLRPTTAGRKLTVESDGVAHADAKEWLGVALIAPDTPGAPRVTIIDGTGQGELLTTAGLVRATDADSVNLATTAQAADIQARLPAALTAGGNMKSDALAVGGNTTVPTNLIVVYATDFASNYNTFIDRWNVATTHWIANEVQADFAAGIPDVNVINWNSGAVPAFPANFNLLGINGSGHISRVVLADTLTTYTGNTPQTGDAFARLGVAGAGLTDLGGMSATMKAQVNTEVLDVVNVDTLVAGKTMAAALRIIGASAAGVCAGAGTGTETFNDFAGVLTLTVAAVSPGNRTSVIYA